MYNLPELDAKTRTFASALGDQIDHETGIDAEIIVDPACDVSHLWHRDNCLLSQSCGYPLVHDYKQHLQAVAIPAYDLDECPKGLYQSVFVVNRKSPYQKLADTRGAIAAINGWDSQSGFNCFRHSLLPLDDGAPYFSSVVVSGGHRSSLRSVAAAQCDIASIDQVTYALIQRDRPEEIANIRVIGMSAPAPCLPFVTSINTSEETKQGLLRALTTIFDQPELVETRKSLLLHSFKAAEPASYQPVWDMAEAGKNFLFTKM